VELLTEEMVQPVAVVVIQVSLTVTELLVEVGLL
jgi:hypothetical protein